MDVKKRTLTTGEAARYCDVNIQTIIRWIDRGLLKAYKLPGRGDSRITVENFLEFLEQNNMPLPSELMPQNNRILIVDDDINIAKAIQRILKNRGMETRHASNGFEAGTMLGFFTPCLVTLDLKMPGMGGREVIATIRNTKVFSHIKILVVSAVPNTELEKALEDGADEVLAKPFKNENLIEKIDNLLTMQHQTDSLEP